VAPKVLAPAYCHTFERLRPWRPSSIVFR
jgi:hypothetical protein